MHFKNLYKNRENTENEDKRITQNENGEEEPPSSEELPNS